MPAPFFIVGPTAVGKSGLAVEVAARCGAEIVGADAFQIYSGFDLLTAKPSLAACSRVQHHLIGSISPAATYNVARYLEDARHALEAISNLGKPALVVGGTGLYIKVLTHGLSPLPVADETIREKLEMLDLPTLLARLRTLDPVAADSIDFLNKRRLIRAIEVCVLTGHPFSSFQKLWDHAPTNPEPNGVFLVRQKEDLHVRIDRRVSSMFAQGVTEEIRTAAPVMLSSTAARMIGLEDIRDYLANRKTLEQCEQNIRCATRQYAKRQITWFQREKGFEPFDLSTCSDEQAQIDWISERFKAHTRRGDISRSLVSQTSLDDDDLRN